MRRHESRRDPNGSGRTDHEDIEPRETYRVRPMGLTTQQAALSQSIWQDGDGTPGSMVGSSLT